MKAQRETPVAHAPTRLHLREGRTYAKQAIVGSFRHCRARLKHSKTRLPSRCGRIPPFEPPRTRLSSDHKGKRHSRGSKDKRPTHNCQAKATKIRPRVNSVVPATTTGLVGKAGLANCLAVRNRRQATLKSFHRWVTTLQEKLGLIDAQV